MNKNQLLKKLKTGVCVVASIGGKNVLRIARLARSSGADIVELRIDDIAKTRKEQGIVKLVNDVRRNIKLPVIATVRSPGEGGASRLSDTQRLRIFESIMDDVDFVDIELSSGSINRKVIKQAHKNHKLVIVSYHNFKTTPSLALLDRYAGEAVKLGADIVKIAAMAKNKKDVRKLLMFCELWRNSPVSVISMGRAGAISRIIGFNYGSCLTYGYVNKSYAPGQISVKELKRSIEKMR